MPHCEMHEARVHKHECMAPTEPSSRSFEGTPSDESGDRPEIMPVERGDVIVHSSRLRESLALLDVVSKLAILGDRLQRQVYYF